MREYNRDGSWEEERQVDGQTMVFHYPKEKQADREKMIARIEGYFGIQGVWHQWDTPELEKLNDFVVKNFLRY